MSVETTYVVTPLGVLRGMKRLLPVSLFVVPFGVAFGAAASEAGLAGYQSLLMSALVFAGAAQFAALDFWTDPMAFVSLALVVLAINARHIIMGAALAPWLNRLPLRKTLLVSSLLSDINFADSQVAMQAGERDVGILLGGGLTLWISWMIGTTIGVSAGKIIGDLSVYGLDVVMVSFFTALVVGSARAASGNLLPIGAAMIVAAMTVQILPVGWNVILGALAGGLIAMVRHAE